MIQKESLRQITLLYIAITVGVAIFAAVAVYLVLIKKLAIDTLNVGSTGLQSISILLALVGIPASYIFHKRKVSHIDKTETAFTKLRQYRTSFFIKMATLEALCLISLLLFMSSGHLNELLIFAIIYVVLLMNYPAKNAILRDLNIDESELK